MSKKALGKGIDALLGEDDKARGVSGRRGRPLRPEAQSRAAAAGLRRIGPAGARRFDQGEGRPAAHPGGGRTTTARYIDHRRGAARARARSSRACRRSPSSCGSSRRRRSWRSRSSKTCSGRTSRRSRRRTPIGGSWRSPSLSQEQVAAQVGKDRSTVANTLRLLKLPEEAREALSRRLISAGHARALLRW